MSHGSPDDVAHLLADACIITTTDYIKGFWQQPLDEESSYLTTFGTEYGRFRFTIMPFGITMQEMFFRESLILSSEIYPKLRVLLMTLLLLVTRLTTVIMIQHSLDYSKQLVKIM